MGFDRVSPYPAVASTFAEMGSTPAVAAAANADDMDGHGRHYFSRSRRGHRWCSSQVNTKFPQIPSGVTNCRSSDAGNWTVCPVAHRTITCRTWQGAARLADSFLQPQQEESGFCLGVCGRLSECQTVAPQATTLTVSASANRMNCNVIMDQYAPLSQNCNIIVTQLSHKRKNRICWP